MDLLLTVLFILVIAALIGLVIVMYRRLDLRTRRGGPVRPYPTSGLFGDRRDKE